MPNTAMMALPKFKLGLENLSADPTHGAIFTGFQGKKKGNDKDNYFGFYIDVVMQSEFKRDKDGGYDKPTLYQGVIRRSAKYPRKRVIVGLSKPASFNPAMARELRLLFKEYARDYGLKRVFTFVKEGDAEPDPTPDEQTDLDAINDRPLRPQAGPSLMDRPGVKPAAPAPKHALDRKEHERAARRADNLQVELSLAPQLADRVAKAKAMSLATAGRAHVELNLIERELDALAANNPMLKVAGVLRGVWETITNEQLTTNPQLVAMYTDTLQHIVAGDLKTAAAMTQKLRNVLLDFKARRDVGLNRRIFLNDAFGAKIPVDVIAEEIGPKLNLSNDAAIDLVTWKITELKTQAQTLRPPGFSPPESKWVEEQAMINPLLPDEARPKFTVDEAYALNAYSDGNYDAINKFIRDGKPPLEPPNDKHYAELKKAFAKAVPFSEPLVVVRGMNFEDPTNLAAFVGKCIKSQKTGELFPLLNFLSTGTANVPTIFNGNVLLTILAKAGIDLQPYTKTPKERELVLNEGTMVAIHSVVLEGTVYKIKCEQILPNVPAGSPAR